MQLWTKKFTETDAFFAKFFVKRLRRRRLSGVRTGMRDRAVAWTTPTTVCPRELCVMESSTVQIERKNARVKVSKAHMCDEFSRNTQSWQSWHLLYCYARKRSCGRVVFSHLSISLTESLQDRDPSGQRPLWTDTPWIETPWTETPRDTSGQRPPDRDTLDRDPPDRDSPG